MTNFEIQHKPSIERPDEQPWPYWPMRLRKSSSHEEGVEQLFSISTKEFLGDKKGNLKGLVTVEVAWVTSDSGKRELHEIEGTEKQWDCDMVLLALGFTGPEKTLIDQLHLETDMRSNVKASTSDYMTSIPGVFTAGDMRRGQSLIVWAIAEGRQVAHHVDAYLMGASALPLKNEESDLPRVG